MTLPTTGAISLNEMHIEAGGTTGTQASINDSDIRGIANSIPAAFNPMPFKFWYGAPFSISAMDTIDAINLVNGYDENGDETGSATFEIAIRHDTANNRIEFRFKQGQDGIYSYDSKYQDYTGDVLDNVNNDLAKWEAKIIYTTLEDDGSVSPATTTFTTPSRNSDQWYLIPTNYDLFYTFKVETTDQDNFSDLSGTFEIRTRCTKSGITMDFTNGYYTSGSKNYVVEAWANTEGGVNP